MSRSSTPSPPPQDLWSTILNSVSSKRSLPSKQVVLLGQPSSGKSTLARALLQRNPTDASSSQDHQNFALGYEWADVRDDADEDTLARLSVYTVPSASSAYTDLIPKFVPPKTSLPHTVVVITLDWTRPWTFLEQLHLWLQWIEKWIHTDDSREAIISREESRERMQNYLQRYADPSTEPIPTSTSAALSDTTLLPLTSGSFTHNSSGIPIVVVCTKADLIDEATEQVSGMVKGKGGEWEERTDSIMQILRTICLKYGAALFYTTQQPDTLSVLRQYILHLLFVPPPASVGSGEPPSRNPFPFMHTPNTLDRDRIMVPAGSDRWGKIVVLREGFDPKAWGEGWEADLESDEQGSQSGALKMFAAIIPDQSTKPPPLPLLSSPMPEQAFLAKNYDENAKRADKDPRGAFRNPTSDKPVAGIVGPLGSSSFSMPNVERALSEMESGINTGATSPTEAAAGRRPTLRPGSIQGPPLSPLSATSARTPGSPALPQNEVLANFFQSLLTNNSRTATASPVKTATSPVKSERVLPDETAK